MKQQIMKVGSSLGVTIPADFVRVLGIKAGDKVEVRKVITKNEIIYKFSGVQQLPITADFLLKKRKRKK